MYLISDFGLLNLADNAQDNLDYFTVLPTEILEIIFSFLNPKFLAQSVLPVCRKFRRFLSDKKWWIRQIRDIGGFDYHLNIRLCDAELTNAEFNPARTFHSILREKKIRKNWHKQKRYVSLTKDEKFDGVKLFKRSGKKYCITASSGCEQSTCIKLWKIDKFKEDNTEENEEYSVLSEDSDEDHDIEQDGLVHEVCVAKQSDLCDIEMSGTDRLVSSCNGTVRLWDICQLGIFERCKKTFDTGMHSLSLQDQILACRRGRSAISLLDAENGFQETARSIELCAQEDSAYITSVKLKGNTVYVLFNNQLMTLDVRKLTGPVHQHSFGDLSYSDIFGTFPISGTDKYTSLSVADGLIHCSHTGGKISVLKAADLTPCYSFYVSENELEQRMLKSVVKTSGSVIACTGTSVRAFTLGSQPACLGVCHDAFLRDAVIDVLHDDVVVGGNGKLTYWTNDYK